MKTRRHRAIDKSKKEIPMIKFFHKSTKNKKEISKRFKKISKEHYQKMNKLIKLEKEMEFKK